MTTKNIKQTMNCLIFAFVFLAMTNLTSTAKAQAFVGGMAYNDVRSTSGKASLYQLNAGWTFQAKGVFVDVVPLQATWAVTTGKPVYTAGWSVMCRYYLNGKGGGQKLRSNGTALK